jgi:hypothetical protein
MAITLNLGPAARAACFLVLVAVICALAPAILLAQPGATDVGEVSAFGGGAFGAGTHPSVGGGTGIAFSRYGMALVEASYTPMGHEIIWRRPDVKSPQNSYLLNFGFSTHVRFPIGERWAPYGIFGGGLLFNSFNAITGPQGALIGIQDFKGEFHTGAGLRYYIREDWGIKPEFQVVVSSRTFTRLSIGVFFNLPSSWP